VVLVILVLDSVELVSSITGILFIEAP